MDQYRESNVKLCIDTILDRFGTWNEAKKAANLPVNNAIEQKPEEVELPEDRDWEELSSYQRYYYKNRESEISGTQKRTRELKSWFK